MTYLENNNNLACVNHIDGDKLNNNDWNLEWTNPRENSCHGVNKSKTSSKYIGVCLIKSNRKWLSSITIGNKTKYLGSFNTELEAYQARCDYENNNNIINKYL